ncbi:MAG: caspase family protein [Deltaproteobacteria bacterium]|nr:caspase family protein [Deltaproteobacteria bacterium]
MRFGFSFCVPYIIQLIIALSSAPCEANRHLLTIASHRGMAGEATLRYAKRDAERLRDVLLQLGGVQPAHAVALVDPSPGDVRQALRTLGRGRVKPGDALLIYISGHMDSQAIHLGPERLSFKEIFTAARTTSALVRVFMLDGCRSGALTRKGLRRSGPVRLIRPRPHPAQGELILTSSAPGEDALESSRLAGSFFTHYLVTGLRGAADGNHDGKVTVEEIFRFAHDRTVYATAGSPTGSQHPSFRLDMAGSGVFALSEQRKGTKEGAQLKVVRPQAGVAYLLNGKTGYLEAELSLAQRATLVVPAGSYRLRIATAKQVREASLELQPGSVLALDRVATRSIPLIALIRKGEGDRQRRPHVAWDLEAGIAALHGFGPLWGARVSASLEWRSISLSLGLSYGYACAANEFIQFDLHQLGLAAEITHPLSLGPLLLSFGLSLEGLALLEQFNGTRRGVETGGGRASMAVALSPLVRLALPVGSHWVPALSLRGRVLLGLQSGVRFAPTLGVGAGWVF